MEVNKMGKIIYKSKEVCGRLVKVEKTGRNFYRCSEYYVDGTHPTGSRRDEKTDYETTDVDDAVITGKAMLSSLIRQQMREVDLSEIKKLKLSSKMREIPLKEEDRSDSDDTQGLRGLE